MQVATFNRLHMQHIVLVHPEIPPNTGNAIRLCANTGWQLHLIEPLGFSMDDKQLRRAGLDYHEYANVLRHVSWDAFLDTQHITADQCFALTTKGQRSVFDAAFKPGVYLVFGSETQGLPPAIRAQIPQDQWLRLPMCDGQRSLNLSNAVAVVGYEAWRQNGFMGAK
jgi:tRNA (cytidine/uridine-2'-O-)-methyltransferase